VNEGIDMRRQNQVSSRSFYKQLIPRVRSHFRTISGWEFLVILFLLTLSDKTRSADNCRRKTHTVTTPEQKNADKNQFG
jgi:hypothetical protein